MAEIVLDPLLVFDQLDAVDAETALRVMAQGLIDLGYVRESFAEAVVAREREFPTGLPTPGCGVAIPHCDACHVLKPTLAVARLKNPVLFRVMGEHDTTVAVDLVLMLAVNDPVAQLDMLKRVSDLFQSEAMLVRLRSAPSKWEVVKLLQEVLDARV